MNRNQLRRRGIALLVTAIAALCWGAFDYISTRQAQEAFGRQEAAQQTPAEATKAIEALGRLAVRDRVSSQGYSRDQFGEGWGKIGDCDTRNAILQRDLSEVTLDHDKCTVVSGVLTQDPYTGKRIVFKRGRNTSSAVQIDHVVALSDAWQKGAQALPLSTRVAFANDPLNLLAADGPANAQKSDKDAAQWLPYAPYRCRYVARQIAVKLAYELWVTKAEHKAMKRTLDTCPTQVLPVVGTSR